MGFDRIFADPNRKVADFSFNTETAQVFEDMLDRSVPGYREIQRMICELASDFAVDGTNVYDLGCSTGTTISNLDGLPQQVRFVGVDSSEAML
jgi:tRNA (cmo5U34)-methyltransferase